MSFRAFKYRFLRLISIISINFKIAHRPGKNEFENGLEPIAWRSEIKDKPVCELKNLIAGKSLIVGFELGLNFNANTKQITF